MNQSKLTDKLRKFRDARGWERFHTSKNLSMLIASEAGELLALFRWQSGMQGAMDSPKREDVADELADVLIGCLYLADNYGIDFEAAILAKMEKNAEKYPVQFLRKAAR